MYLIIVVFGILWVVSGVGIGLDAMFGEPSGLAAGIAIAAVCVTAGVMQMGFAEIVKYFELMNRKRKSGDQRR